MSVQDQLQIIKKLSGMTQQSMSNHLGVSFPTLNSWINAKSQPHPNALSKIQHWYLDLAGQKTLSEDPLLAKKEIILTKKKSEKDMLSLLLKRKDLFEQFLLSLTYNSNRIEGSTMTVADTMAILFENRTLSNRTLVEQLEAKNHETALRYLFRTLNGKKKKVTEELILKLHEILMNGILDNAGCYRRHQVRIVGSHVPTANYLRIESLMKDFVRDCDTWSKDQISHMTLMHSRFEKIHPFSDGNGRVGRLLMNFMALQKNFAPPLIHEKERRSYYNALRKSQLKEIHESLEDFVCDAFLNAYQIIEN